MSKIKLGMAPKPFKKKDIEFKFSDVARKNPKTETKTPLYLYINESVPKRHRSKIGWWITNGETR